jgi:hypothetical protein
MIDVSKHYAWSNITSLTRPAVKAVREHEVLRVAGSLKGDDPVTAADLARSEVLTWARNRSGSPLPKEAWKFLDFEHVTAGRNIDGIRIKTPNTDIWAIRAEDPDKEVAGRTWTTEIVVGFQSDEPAKFSARLLVSSPQNSPIVVPHSPGIIQQISECCGLSNGSYSARPEAWIVDNSDDAEELIGVLLDLDRRLPVFVLTVSELSDDPYRPLIDANSLARATLGTAYVVVLTAKQTWVLTERLGKHRSVFGGAVRAYMPGFTESAIPYDHRLVIADALNSNGDVNQCMRWMRSLSATESLRQFALGSEVLAFSAIRNAQSQFAQNQLISLGASDSDKLEAAEKRIFGLEKQNIENESLLTYYSDEHQIAEDRAKSAEEQLRAATFRVQQLQAQLRASGTEPDSGIVLPNDWNDFENWCDTNLTGRLTLAAAARRNVRSPDFDDIGLLARILLWLANEFRNIKINGSGSGTLRDVEVEDGIRNTHCGSDAFDLDWNGRRYTADWHVKNGGNTRDPKRCLRVYYFWHEETQQVVVADMPAHRRTDAS